jgi:Domain of Unknown Function (DUF1080)
MTLYLKQKYFLFRIQAITIFLIGIAFPLKSGAQSIYPWQSLFDGKSLNGWSVIGKPSNVQIKDSCIILHMTPFTSRHAFIRTTKKFKDFIFEIEFRRDLAIDSGILFRSVDAPDTAFNDLFGYMVKIDPSQSRLWTGGVLLDFGNGLQWLYPLDKEEKARHAEKSQGEWNKIRIEAIGQDIKVWLNEIPTVHLTDDKYDDGYIALKIHYLMEDKEKAGLEISYRNPQIIMKHVKRYARSMEIPANDTRAIKEVKYFR